jgi:yecA family protein
MFRSAKAGSYRYSEAPALVPPTLDKVGQQPFTSRELESLAQWLHEPVWPRGTLNIYGLEGYLTALLVWPVSVQPGAWLPPIWNEAGWRVRPPIDASSQYEMFLELIVGFLRTIDRGLLQTPPVVESTLGSKFIHDTSDIKTRGRHWAQGFGRALSLGVQSRTAPAPSAREAVHIIAAHAADQPYFSEFETQRIQIALSEAVFTLAGTRGSRGPLGAFPRQSVAAKHSTSETQAQGNAGPLKAESP